MTKEEIAKRFCKFELCTHRNGEGMCCLYNQDNCIFHRLEKENAELKSELKNWKDEWQEQVQKAIDEGYARTLQTIQLTKAKEIIREIMKYDIPTLDYEKAEQFIKEVER